ncbi:MAG TPA: serine hydrolase [Mycobacteriales bacterium]|jgi:beta-lactamase class A|nr:serine hydrolase [Mycobacteriales bacterium]
MTPTQTAFVSSSPEGAVLAESIFHDWNSLDVTGHFLARNIDTDEQLGFDIEIPVPLASVVKVPIALAVLERTADGSLDPAQPLTVDPATSSLGPTGIAAFRYPATLAIGDLVYQMLAVSDNASGDTLLDLIGLDALGKRLRAWKCPGISVRHRLQRMHDCAVGAVGNDFGLALELAIQDDHFDGQHKIETLDIAHGNIGTALALTDLLQRIWLDEIASPAATAEMRRLMSQQVFTHRLSSDLRADTLTVSAKTGAFLHLRHEIGIIESDTGSRIAVAALTRSSRRASIAQDIDLAIGAAARAAFEHLR